MTLALTLISDAYQMSSLLGIGEPLTNERAQYGLDRLNDMLDMWAADSILVKEIVETIATVPAGQSFNVGPGQVVNTAIVPIRLEQGGFFRSGGIDYPFAMVDREEYMQQAYKATSSPWPSMVFYNSGTTYGTCHLFPALGSPTEVHLQLLSPLTQIATINTDVTLPVGYKKAITESLSEILCIGRKTPSAELVRSAKGARAVIKDANASTPDLRYQAGPNGNILTGWEV